MKVTITTDKVTREQLLKRAFFMLYNACVGPMGMGILQARQGVTEDDVWANVADGLDYPDDLNKKAFARGQVYGDYVFGRMMKWGVKLTAEDEKGFKVIKDVFDPEYNGFAGTYSDNKAIFDAAMKDLGVDGGYEMVES